MADLSHDTGATSGAAPDDWEWVSAMRADIYAWFSSVFALELSDVTLGAYRNGDAAPLMAAFRKMGLASEADRLQRAIDGWGDIPLLRVELAADFARLFLTDARDAAAPYASAYLDPQGQMYGEPHSLMQQFLGETGLQVSAAFKEPADHLAVALACFEAQVRKDAGSVAMPEGEPATGVEPAAVQPVDSQAGAVPASEVAAAARQRRFLNEVLLSWLPVFDQRCQQLGAQLRSDFYPALAALLLAFVSEDAASLEATGARS